MKVRICMPSATEASWRMQPDKSYVEVEPSFYAGQSLGTVGYIEVIGTRGRVVRRVLAVTSANGNIKILPAESRQRKVKTRFDKLPGAENAKASPAAKD